MTKNLLLQLIVICGLSGGVDSSVTAILLHLAIGDQLTCIFVDNGLLRSNEADEVVSMFRDNYNIKLIHADEQNLFLNELKGKSDPEQKRKTIGKLFIDVFQKYASQIENVDFLAQGTLYPDVIESVSFSGGPSSTIKSHHNVGGLPKKMGLKLVEPLRELFKDEVRSTRTRARHPRKLHWTTSLSRSRFGDQVPRRNYSTKIRHFTPGRRCVHRPN